MRWLPAILVVLASGCFASDDAVIVPALPGQFTVQYLVRGDDGAGVLDIVVRAAPRVLRLDGSEGPGHVMYANMTFSDDATRWVLAWTCGGPAWNWQRAEDGWLLDDSLDAAAAPVRVLSLAGHRLDAGVVVFSEDGHALAITATRGNSVEVEPRPPPGRMLEGALLQATFDARPAAKAFVTETASFQRSMYRDEGGSSGCSPVKPRPATEPWDSLGPRDGPPTASPSWGEVRAFLEGPLAPLEMQRWRDDHPEATLTHLAFADDRSWSLYWADDVDDLVVYCRPVASDLPSNPVLRCDAHPSMHPPVAFIDFGWSEATPDLGWVSVLGTEYLGGCRSWYLDVQEGGVRGDCSNGAPVHFGSSTVIAGVVVDVHTGHLVAIAAADGQGALPWD